MGNRDIRRFDEYIGSLIGGRIFDFTAKENNVKQHMLYMLDRTQSMFEYDGLPDSIPSRILELYLQTNGNVCFYKHEGTLYIFTGGMGGEPDVYYRPTIYTIANPALSLSKNLRINEECIVIPNDSLFMGFGPLFSRYATAIAETELSLEIAAINSRLISLISASDDKSRESAERLIERVIDGKLSVIGETAFLDGVKTLPYSGSNTSGYITNLIELEQYFKASWFNEIGLNANYNMKRESLNSSESQMNNDALLPLVDDMLKCRQEGLEKVNSMFGTNISVKLNSSWEDNEIEIGLEHEEISVQTETDEEMEVNQDEEITS